MLRSEANPDWAMCSRAKTMFPWFICLLTTPPGGRSDRTFPGFPREAGVWWSPTDSSGDFGGFRIEEGDILMPSLGNGKLKNAVKSKEYLWEGGIIPFEFGENFTCSEENLILQAMEVLQAKTCVEFVEKTNQETFVRFQKENGGCFAPIGRLPGNEGPLPVNLQSPECFKERGIIEHELLHVAGLFHEHSRPDRDEFVTVHWCNIQPHRESDFLKGSYHDLTTFDLPYDYGSIMHYPRWAFSRNGKPTITAKGDWNRTLGQREAPSVGDFEKVIKMYGCKLGGRTLRSDLKAPSEESRSGRSRLVGIAGGRTEKGAARRGSSSFEEGSSGTTGNFKGRD